MGRGAWGSLCKHNGSETEQEACRCGESDAVHQGVLAVRAIRKDSARGVSWRYGVGLLYLGCVCVAGSRRRQAPLKRPGHRCKRRAVVLGDPRQQALCQGQIAQW